VRQFSPHGVTVGFVLGPFGLVGQSNPYAVHDTASFLIPRVERSEVS
jgi:hypothetical protein